MNEERYMAVTISRQMGSGGHYIGYLTAKELGFKYVDREVLHEAAKYFGTNVSHLEHYDERSSSFIEKVLKGFFFGTPEISGIPPLKQPVYDTDLYTLECKIMNEIADRYSTVVIGRGGFYAFRDRSTVFRVFIHAPLEFRIRRVMKAQQISDIKEGRAIVEESDHRRGKFIRDMAGVDWTDVRNYDLCIDSSVAAFPAIAGTIIKLVKEKERSG